MSDQSRRTFDQPAPFNVLPGEPIEPLSRRAVAHHLQTGKDFVLEMNGVTFTVTEHSTAAEIAAVINGPLLPLLEKVVANAQVEQAKHAALIGELEALDRNDLPALRAWITAIWPDREPADIKFVRRYAKPILDTYERHGFSPTMGYQYRAKDGEYIFAIMRVLRLLATYTEEL